MRYFKSPGTQGSSLTNLPGSPMKEKTVYNSTPLEAGARGQEEQHFYRLSSPLRCHKTPRGGHKLSVVYEVFVQQIYPNRSLLHVALDFALGF